MEAIDIEIGEKIKEKIREIEGFPKEGINFKDITPLLSDSVEFNNCIDKLAEYYSNKGITKVCGIESRGFILGSVLAYKLNAGFVPIRKQGKLPYKTQAVNYDLEYGTDCVEMHTDAINEDDIVLIHDDVLATGGTINAAAELVRKFTQKKIYLDLILELSFLNGRGKIIDPNCEVHSLVSY